MSQLQPTIPEVSAIVLCRNEAALIEECLVSLLAQEPPPGGFEILVADGMSDDGTRAILSRLAVAHPNLRILDNHQRITPCGMNLGIRSARGRWVAILGSHNRYASDYLLRCYEVACQTGADNTGGAMFCEGGGPVQTAIAAAHHSPFSCGGASWHNPAFDGPVDTVFGGFYRREVFDRIGYFDESLVRNQDDELNLRLTRAGGRIWHSPKIQSWYRPRSSLASLFKQYTQYGYWKVRVIQKHQLPASWRHLVPGAFVLTLIILFLLFVFSFLVALLPTDYRTLTEGGFLFGRVLALALGAYAAAVLAASVHTAAKSKWKLLPILPLVFPCYHFGYGYGFLRGVWDFVIRRKAGHQQFQTLTR